MGLLLHDIGKLAVPTEALNKPGALNPEEWELMKSHPRVGVELLGPHTICPLVRAGVLRHHERWDGSGYPYGIAGENIHQMARIAAVADVYDAVTSARAYAEAKPAHEGARLILEGSARRSIPRSSRSSSASSPRTRPVSRSRWPMGAAELWPAPAAAPSTARWCGS
jgi:putative two-component system response regulator